MKCLPIRIRTTTTRIGIPRAGLSVSAENIIIKTKNMNIKNWKIKKQLI